MSPDQSQTTPALALDWEGVADESMAPEDRFQPASPSDLLVDPLVSPCLGSEGFAFVRDFSWQVLADSDAPLELRVDAAARLRHLLKPEERERLADWLREGGADAKCLAALALCGDAERHLSPQLYTYLLRMSRGSVETGALNEHGCQRLLEVMNNDERIGSMVAALNLRHYGSQAEQTAALDRLMLFSRTSDLSARLSSVVSRAIASYWKDESTFPLHRQIVMLDLTGRSVPATWSQGKLDLAENEYLLRGVLPFSPLESVATGGAYARMIDINRQVGEFMFPVVVVGRNIELAEEEPKPPAYHMLSHPLMTLRRAARGLDIEALPIDLHGKGACVAFYLKPPVYCTLSATPKLQPSDGVDELRVYGNAPSLGANVCLRLWRAKNGASE